MGHFSASGNSVWQQLTGALGNLLTKPTTGNGGVWGTPAYFNGQLYYGPRNLPLLAFTIAECHLVSSPRFQQCAELHYPGTSPAICANGTANGIVWAELNPNPNAAPYAFDATNLANMLYNSTQVAGGRDQFGLGTTFVTPTVADGKVFVSTTTGVAVFGLLN
jgi:hypothetical protein